MYDKLEDPLIDWNLKNLNRILSALFILSLLLFGGFIEDCEPFYYLFSLLLAYYFSYYW
jgi:hypothetical protein